ncbi:MAG TPA: hypothetical protein VFC09_08945 [Candidatus Dormibacteraeota bacterium]|nr:hypothetical protein [Candidatus Dormibacteraeota bacterium]
MRRVLVLGAVLLGAAWALAPAPSPPLYDGLQGPAQAYLYLTPPPGYHQTGAPSGASHALAIAGGSSGAGFINTEETPPQAQVLAADGTFTFPPGATSITLSVTPVAPPSPIPASLGTLAGNVYHVTATANVPGPVSIVAAHPMTVVLRGPVGTGTSPIVRMSEGTTTWQRVTTVPLGSAPDMVVTNTDQLGYFAIAEQGGSSSPGGSGGGPGTASGSSSGGFPVVVVVIAVVVLLAVLGGLLAMRSRTRRRPPPRRRR